MQSEVGRARLLEAIRDGDLREVENLLAEGVSPDAEWDAELAAERYEEELRMLGAWDDELSQAENFAEDEGQWCPSGPYSHEIPLMVAASHDELEILRALIDKGADWRALDASGRSALYYARSRAMLDELLEIGLPLDDEDRFGWSPLVSAVHDGARAMVEMLLDAGADVHATHDRGYTVFMSAVSCMERSIDVIDLLVERGADPLQKSELGYTALHAAIDVNGEANAEESVREVFRYLVDAGVDMEARNHQGQTPLIRALSFGTTTEVRVLLELGADPNARAQSGSPMGPPGSTPLIMAVGRPEQVELLLNAGADPTAESVQDGWTALARAEHMLNDVLEEEEPYDDWHGQWIASLERTISLLQRSMQ